jgi:hypothetical protein
MGTPADYGMAGGTMAQGQQARETDRVVEVRHVTREEAVARKPLFEAVLDAYTDAGEVAERLHAVDDRDFGEQEQQVRAMRLVLRRVLLDMQARAEGLRYAE